MATRGIEVREHWSTTAMRTMIMKLARKRHPSFYHPTRMVVEREEWCIYFQRLKSTFTILGLVLKTRKTD